MRTRLVSSLILLINALGIVWAIYQKDYIGLTLQLAGLTLDWLHKHMISKQMMRTKLVSSLILLINALGIVWAIYQKDYIGLALQLAELTLDWLHKHMSSK